MTPDCDDLVQLVGGQLLVGLVAAARRWCMSTTSAAVMRAFELAGLDFDLLDLVAAQRLAAMLGGDLAACRSDLFALDRDGVRRTRALQVGRAAFGCDLPVQLAVVHVDGVDGVEGLEDLLVGTQAERAQEDGAEELALAVDADVEGVLLVVLELDPAAAVRNDLAEEVGAVVRGLEEDAGRTVQLRDDDALGAVDDEGAVLASSAECRRRRLPAPSCRGGS